MERREPACPTCGSAVAPFEVSEGRCRECRQRPARVSGTVRVGPYKAYLGQAVRAFKYKGREELGTVLGGWLAKAVEQAPWRERVEAIVSVPTHWRRRLTRPFHAAEPLASVVGRQAGLPRVPILRRVRAGPRQIGLSHTERAKNVLGAFAIRKGVTLRRARLLLIDDVRTTGATIEECAKVLRRNGAAEVYAAVIVTVGWARPGAQLLGTV